MMASLSLPCLAPQMIAAQAAHIFPQTATNATSTMLVHTFQLCRVFAEIVSKTMIVALSF